MRKWYSLIDKVYAMDNLRLAFNTSSPTMRSRHRWQTVKDFQTRLEENLAAIHAELKPTRTSQAGETGGNRERGWEQKTAWHTYGKDRVVQQALRQIIEPIFEPDFHPSSYGYRPNRPARWRLPKQSSFSGDMD